MAATVRVFESSADWATVRVALAAHLPDRTIAALDAAVAFASRWHGDQRRPAGEPYLEHLLETVDVLVNGAGVRDGDVLVAAVLHDVVEDTACTLDGVRVRFGERVAELVGWVTKPAPVGGDDAAAARARYLEALRDAPGDAVVLKLADRVSNVQRLHMHPRPQKRRSYYWETVEHIVPLSVGQPFFGDWYAHWRQQFRFLDDATP